MNQERPSPGVHQQSGAAIQPQEVATGGTPVIGDGTAGAEYLQGHATLAAGIRVYLPDNKRDQEEDSDKHMFHSFGYQYLWQQIPQRILPANQLYSII